MDAVCLWMCHAGLLRVLTPSRGSSFEERLRLLLLFAVVQPLINVAHAAKLGTRPRGRREVALVGREVDLLGGLLRRQTLFSEAVHLLDDITQITLEGGGVLLAVFERRAVARQHDV